MSISVAVSGVAGFVGGHIARDLLRKGYIVHGTVRKNPLENIAHLTSEPSAADSLKIFEADLLTEGSFNETVKDCKYAMHVASPCAMDVHDAQRELVEPAINGTLNFLRSCKAAGVEKVVLTSSVAAIADEGRKGYVFTEKDFNTKSTLSRLPYYLSKVAAEKAAWKFVEDEAPNVKLVVINPFVVVGPALTGAKNVSAQLFADIVKGAMYGILDMEWTLVDVRDVSNAHILAMESETAEGRYVCAASEHPMHLREVVEVMTAKGFKPPTRDLSGGFVTKMIKASSFVMPGGQLGVYTRNHLGNPIHVSNAKIVKDLGMTFMDPKKTLEETLDTLVKWGYLDDPATAPVVTSS